MKSLAFLLPNALTLSALSCGLASAAASMRGQARHAALAILAAALLDALDGWAARMTGSATRFGRRLDSVSDFVSFCVAPAALAYRADLESAGWLGGTAVLIYVVCGGSRLLRFDAQAESAERFDFTGLPTTGAAIVIAALSLCAQPPEGRPVGQPVWACLVLALSFLMVSTIRYRSAKSLFRAHGAAGRALAPISAVCFLALSAWAPVAILTGATAYAAWGPAEGAWRRLRIRGAFRRTAGAG
jgi:CDP-diacylglycerol---serine O-phosphatidyltransferase